MTVFIVAVVLALVVSFMCSIFEAVLLSIGHARVETLVRDGHRAGLLLRNFKRKIDVPIAAVLIVNTVAHTVGSTVAGASYANAFSSRSLWLFTLVFTTAVLLFTEIVPKTLGVTHADRLAAPVAHGIHFLTRTLWPLIALTERLSRLLRGSAKAPVTSVEEIRLLAQLGRNEGVVGARTASIIAGATQLSQLRAQDVMVPRQEVTLLSASRSLQSNLEVARAAQHSRFPFSSSVDLDNATGVVLIKDLLFHLQRYPSKAFDWASVVREMLVVPASKPVNALLRTFKESRMHMAFVVDDYDEIKGIVTLEDVLEEIVGEISDESDEPVNFVWEQADGTLRFIASTDLRRVCERLRIAWDADMQAATLGGLVTVLQGSLPREGDMVRWEGFTLTVAKAGERRAELIDVAKIPA
jgi:CBS domain containing-hemolysin-like protein